MTNLESLVRSKERGSRPFQYDDAISTPRRPPTGPVKVTNEAYVGAVYTVQAAEKLNYVIKASWAAIHSHVEGVVRHNWAIADSRMAQQIAGQIEKSQNQAALIEEVLSILRQNKVVHKGVSNEVEADANELLEYLYNGPTEEASSDDILKVVQAMFGWLSAKAFDKIDYCFRSADLSRLAPELQLAMLRTTARHRENIQVWGTFYTSVKIKFEQWELDTEDLLQGL